MAWKNWNVLAIYLQILEDRDRRQSQQRDQLHRERRQLRKRLEELTDSQGYRVRVERSISECSVSTNSSTSTASPCSSESGRFLSLPSDQETSLAKMAKLSHHFTMKIKPTCAK